MTADIVSEVKWNEQGLIPAIVQSADNGQVLMLAWMDEAALLNTIKTQKAHFWSRSRQASWMKGETSGHTQEVIELRLDCDSDTVLLKVKQHGGIACHTGRARCFYKRYDNDQWVTDEDVIKDPTDIYPGK